jgi:hypothetical protein
LGDAGHADFFSQIGRVGFCGTDDIAIPAAGAVFHDQGGLPRFNKSGDFLLCLGDGHVDKRAALNAGAAPFAGIRVKHDGSIPFDHRP